MLVKDEASAHEFAQSWIKEASPVGALRAIERCAESQSEIVASLRSSGHDATDNEAAERTLRTYAATLRADGAVS